MTYRPWSIAAVLALCASSLASCGGDPHELSWRIQFEDDALKSMANLVEVDVLAGGCSGASIFNDPILITSQSEMTPGELGPGTYGIRAVARTIDCNLVAQKCVELEFPPSEDEVLLLLERSTGGPYDCAATDICADGRCLPTMGDGGVEEDAGPPVECTGEGSDCMDPGGTRSGTCHDSVCCFGCWDGTMCRNGGGVAGCGMGGDACEACGFGNQCQLGACITRVDQPEFSLEVHGSFLRIPGSPIYISDDDKWSQRGTSGVGTEGDFNAFTETPAVFVDVAASQLKACGIDSGGVLWCWGATSATDMQPMPREFGPFDTRWTDVEGGDFHFCGIDADGFLLCWGQDADGQLGTTGMNLTNPQRVDGGGRYSQVSSRFNHTCGIRSDGTLWCWGKNTNGQVGIPGGMDMTQGVPIQVGTDSDWVDVDTGNAHTCGIRASGDRTLFCWGKNDVGQLGLGSIGGDEPAPQAVVGTGWHSAEAGENFVCALRDVGDRALFCWGFNGFGQLGIPDAGSNAPERIGTNTWQSLAVGWRHTCGVRSNGAYECWGDNVFSPPDEFRGKVGSGDTMNLTITTPTAIILDPMP